MDQKELVEEIRKVIDLIIIDKEYINFVMILPDNNDEISCTILIGAKWLNDLSPYEGTKLIYEYFIKSMANEQLASISRINLINTKDPSVQMIYNAICTRHGIGEISRCNFFGVFIEHAYILESHRGRKC